MLNLVNILLNHRCQTQFLEGRSSEQFTSNPNQKHLPEMEKARLEQEKATVEANLEALELEKVTAAAMAEAEALET